MGLCMLVSPKHRNPKSLLARPPVFPVCPCVPRLLPASFCPLRCGQARGSVPLASSDPVSHCQFSFILETSFPPSDGAEGSHGFKSRDPGGMSLPAPGVPATTEGHSLGKEGEREIPVWIKRQ